MPINFDFSFLAKRESLSGVGTCICCATLSVDWLYILCPVSTFPFSGTKCMTIMK